MKHVTDRKGYIVVEAAIFLPVFVLVVVSIIYYINFFSVIEGVAYSTIEETARTASKAKIVEVTPGFTSILKTRIENDNPAVQDYHVNRYRYRYWDGDLNNMISVNAEYYIELKLPLGFNNNLNLESNVKCRGFTGVKRNGNPMSFDEMESDGVWDPVWIFPTSGEKYHSSSCTYVRANAKEMVLSTELRHQYDSCQLCDSENIPIGTYVYCFTENGTVYHGYTCRQVERYAVEINKEEAVDKGYGPCSRCGGG